jgi:hypothetical protein
MGGFSSASLANGRFLLWALTTFQAVFSAMKSELTSSNL